MSYWSAMRKVDARCATLEAWEKASLDDPYFPLKVTWKPAGQTIGEVIEQMMAHLATPPPTTCAQLVQLLAMLTAKKRAASPARLFG